jgi:hypothetical protein
MCLQQKKRGSVCALGACLRRAPSRRPHHSLVPPRSTLHGPYSTLHSSPFRHHSHTPRRRAEPTRRSSDVHTAQAATPTPPRLPLVSRGETCACVRNSPPVYTAAANHSTIAGSDPGSHWSQKGSLVFSHHQRRPFSLFGTLLSSSCVYHHARYKVPPARLPMVEGGESLHENATLLICCRPGRFLMRTRHHVQNCCLGQTFSVY